MEKGKFTNFKNSSKINKNSYDNNFFTVVIRRKSEIYFSGVSSLFSELSVSKQTGIDLQKLIIRSMINVYNHHESGQIESHL